MECLKLTIEEVGIEVASVWEGLRPTTRIMVERALEATAAHSPTRVKESHDARAEWELSRLLTALDGRVAALEHGAPEIHSRLTQQPLEIKRMAEACAAVLYAEAHSAEVFAQLLQRALRINSYDRVDEIGGVLVSRLAPSELCELARHENVIVRAVALEAMLEISTPALVQLLTDPVDAEVARIALERQAGEYGSEEARWILSALEKSDSEENGSSGIQS